MKKFVLCLLLGNSGAALADKTAALAANDPQAAPTYSLSEQLAAEVATMLCEDPRYQRCTAESQGRCVLEMGLVASGCAEAQSGAGDAAMVAALTGCLIDGHAQLLGFEANGLLSCYAATDEP